MKEVLKTFETTIEGVTLELSIYEVFEGKEGYKMSIMGRLESNRNDVEVSASKNGTVQYYTLLYKEKGVFSFNFNLYHGLRWNKSKTDSLPFKTVEGKKNSYVTLLDFIPKVQKYFYDSMAELKKYQQISDISIGDIVD